jgi:hypothetical protein
MTPPPVLAAPFRYGWITALASRLKLLEMLSMICHANYQNRRPIIPAQHSQ